MHILSLGNVKTIDRNEIGYIKDIQGSNCLWIASILPAIFQLKTRNRAKDLIAQAKSMRSDHDVKRAERLTNPLELRGRRLRKCLPPRYPRREHVHSP